jgi:hypothetical protein
MVGELHAESPSVSNIPFDSTNAPTQASQPEEVLAAAGSDKRALEEQNGEVVVEAEEDTVIY